MNKKIAFGAGEGIYVDNNTKNIIIDYLYSKLNLSQHRYIMLSTTQKLKFLQTNEHLVAPNFRGFNYFLIMMSINDKNYCVVIDRKKLSYHKDQIDMKTVFMLQLNFKTSETFFKGTIFDGKLIQSKDGYIFLIQDCFYLMGNKMMELGMEQKFIKLDNLFNDHFNKNATYCNNFNLKLNKLYKYSDLEELIYTTMPAISIPTNGIIFYPKFSGVNIIHIEKTNEKVEIKNNTIEVSIDSKSYHMIHNFVDFLKNRSYSFESNGKTKMMWLTRTEIPDVYDLSEQETSERLGIAHIPSLKISQLCDKFIIKSLKFNCIYCSKFKKWIPISPIM